MLQKDERELNILANKLERYRMEIQHLERQIQAINHARESISSSRETIKELKNKTEEETILVPLKGEIFIQAKIKGVKSVIIDIGAEIGVEYSLENAEKHLNKRILRMEEKIKELSDFYVQLINQYNEQQVVFQEYIKRDKSQK